MNYKLSPVTLMHSEIALLLEDSRHAARHVARNVAQLMISLNVRMDCMSVVAYLKKVW